MWPFFCSPILLFPLWFYFMWSYCDQLGQILHGMISLNILMTLQQPHPYGMRLLLRSLFSSALQTLISRFPLTKHYGHSDFGPLPFLSRNIFILWVAFIISTLLHTYLHNYMWKNWNHDFKSQFLSWKSSWLLFQIFIIKIFVIKKFYVMKIIYGS